MEASVFTFKFSLFAEGGVSIFPEDNPFLKIPCLPVARWDQKLQENAVQNHALQKGSNY